MEIWLVGVSFTVLMVCLGCCVVCRVCRGEFRDGAASKARIYPAGTRSERAPLSPRSRVAAFNDLSQMDV